MIQEKLNFCRVFELPDNYPSGYRFGDGNHPSGYCFGGGVSTNFKMVGLFNPIPSEDFYEKKVKRWEDYIPMIREFLLKKKYVKPNRKYIVITDFDESFIFKG
ncbi:MAG TPA: hypothetical protein VMX17_15510 [Candidatus Glassbacteria bacterium]|nr:hypothetical protein [Candidatus Glassbacteria bacterium]